MTDEIFISYRRQGGDVMAQLLHDRLVDKGYDVFYDIESLKSGPFDIKLYEKIEACNDFILILPPGALDRCIYEEDWVRQEIRHALHHHKNIIPVMMYSFEFPSDLPDDIKDICRFSGMRMESMQYLDAKIDHLVSLLTCSPDGAEQKPFNPYEKDAEGRRSMIANVCTKGGVDRAELWPNGAYSPVIDLDRFNVVLFHVRLLEAFVVSKTARHGFRIYDDAGALVASHTSEVEFNATHSQYSVGWIIRGEDGSYVKAGKYCAEIWLEDYRPYILYFRIASKEQEECRQAERVASKAAGYYNEKEHARIRTLKRYLAAPKALVLLLLQQILGLICLFTWTMQEPFWTLILGAVSVTLLIALIKHIKQNIVNNLFFALIFVLLFGFYFGIYLFVISLACVVQYKKWEVELQHLQEKNL